MARRSSTTTQFASATTNYAATMPAGVVAHDRLLAAVIYDGFSATISGIPSGWVQIANADHGPDTQTMRIFEKKDASGSEGATQTWTLSLAKAGQVIIGAWSGRDNSAAASFVSTPGTQNTTVTSPMSLTGPSGTAVAGDDIAVFASVDQNIAANVWTFSAWSGSLIEREDSANGNLCSSGMATQDAVSGGAFGAVSVTATSVGNDGGWGIVAVALPVAAGGGGGSTQKKNSIGIGIGL